MKNYSKMLKKLIIATLLFSQASFAYAPRPYVYGADDRKQEVIDYAWDVSGDPSFIYTLEAESSAWSPYKRSNGWVWYGGRKTYDWGICQISERWHPEIVRDPRFFKDWKWQVDECWRLYASGTRFYGSDRENHVKNRFSWR